MANSKSNIYPIQLQGAELCLNRYDAEIKQYRGFNKNNSPFVGGCLSNVFTKEEQISGGNADNTYIDINGDVYRVDAEGMYLNGNMIKSYPEGTRFYKNEKIVINKYANIEKVYNENVFIFRSNSSLYAHCFDVDIELLSLVLRPYPPFSNVYCDLQEINEHYVFTAKSTDYDEYNLNGVHGHLAIVIIKDGEVKYQNVETLEYLTYASGVGASNIKVQKPMAVFGVEGGCIFAPNANTKTSNNRVYPFRFINFSTYTSTPISDFETTDTVLSTKTCDYYMTNDGSIYLKGLRSGITLTGAYYVSGCLTYENGSLIFHKALWGYTSTEKIIAGAGLGGLFFPWYFSGAMTQSVSGGGLVDSVPCSNHLVPGFGFTTGTYANVGNFKILTYAGEVIGISVMSEESRKYYNELETNLNLKNKRSVGMGVLVTEWNSVVDDSIVLINDNEIVYKNTSDNNFYRITLDAPKLSLKDNQVVTNAAITENSIRITDKKILSFANDWNCAYLLLDLTTGGYSQTFWVASAINEYNLKDNASIILNQVEVTATYTPNSTRPMDYRPFINVPIAKYIPKCAAINFYRTTSASETLAVYQVTKRFEGDMFTVEDLINKPFPNNTDGNVQYNPNLFSDFFSSFGTDVFVRTLNNTYQLMKEGQENIMSFFLGTLVEGLELVFIIQGQYYGIMNNKLFGLQFNNGVIADTFFIVNTQGLQFVGNTPYEALFFSKTNRCLYSFTGANVLNQKQLVDKISEVRNYLYNPATQTVFLITDIGVLFYGLFGMFLLEYTDIINIFLLNNGIVMSDNSGNYRYIKYYLDEGDTDYIKENINVETSFYGMNNEVVTINDCLYFRIFSEEHEEGDLKVSATTISLRGRKTEETTFKIKASDWDKITHTIYLRYQPKTQRGLGVAFAIDSPFKIASLSVGSQPDAVLVDKVSKGAITAPSVTTNNNEW